MQSEDMYIHHPSRVQYNINLNRYSSATSVRVQPSGERVQLSAVYRGPCDAPDVGTISSEIYMYMYLITTSDMML